MADAEQKPMSTVILYSTTHENHLKSLEYLATAIKADERCEHKMCFRPLMLNTFQFIRGVADDNGMTIIGCHEVLYLPGNRQADIERLKRFKNVIAEENCMTIVNNEEKTKKLIDWLLEETEEIML